MITVGQIAAYLDELAPLALAESWDNVGLLVGDRAHEVSRVMTCLTITPESVEEAIDERADLIVSHHPLPFRPLANITTDAPPGRQLWQLAGSRISVYSAHTAFDSAREGINKRLAAGLGLRSIVPLIPRDSGQAAGDALGEIGAGRMGDLPAGETLASCAARAKQFLRVDKVGVVGRADREVRRLAVACGSGGDFLEAAHAAGCDALLTGEARFHTWLDAAARGVGLLLAGHFATERFGVEALAGELAAKFPMLHVWASRRETDPLVWI